MKVERFVDKIYHIDLKENTKTELLIKALNCKTRRDILRVLGYGSQSIWQIAQKLNVPLSSISEHVSVLLKTGLVSVIATSKDRGHGKIIARQYEKIMLNIFDSDYHAPSNRKNHTMQLPIGSYVNFKVNKYCGMCDENSYIERRDDPDIFYSPKRTAAQLIWFDYGFLEYKIAIKDIDAKKIVAIGFSLEICSEAPWYNEDWKSDIFFEVNNKEVCVYTSPGDFGARRGLITPEWWKGGTQYGLMKHVEVTASGTYLDGQKASEIELDQLGLINNNIVTFKIGIREDAKNRRGLNLFGRKFGDYNHHILFTVTYDE